MDETEHTFEAVEITVPPILGGAVISGKEITGEALRDVSDVISDSIKNIAVSSYSVGRIVASKRDRKQDNYTDKSKDFTGSIRISNKQGTIGSEKVRNVTIKNEVGNIENIHSGRKVECTHLGKSAKGVSRLGKKVSAVADVSTAPAKAAIREYAKMEKISELLNSKDVSEMISIIGKRGLNKGCAIVASMIKCIFISVIKIFTSLLIVLLPYFLLFIIPVIIVICISASTLSGNHSTRYSDISEVEEVSETDIASASSLAGYNFMWPVDLSGYQCLTSRFGYRQAPTAGASSAHQGVDIACMDQTPIYAAADGIVSYAGWTSGGGYTITINHGKDADGKTVETTYMHNSLLKVKAGIRVKQGQTIALAGSTGISTGTHCHMNIVIDGTHYNALYAYDVNNLKAKRSGKIVTEAITVDRSYYTYLYYNGDYVEASKVKGNKK